MMQKQKVKLLLCFAALLSVLALVVVPAWADGCTCTLTVSKAGAGTGTVTSDDGKINCGADCEATYDCGELAATGKLMSEPQVVTLTATPDEGSVFSRWSGGCVQQVGRGGTGGHQDPTNPVILVYMNANRSCTANFGLPVGGVMVPVDKLGLLAPWAGLTALASLVALTVALVRRRSSA